MVRGLQRNLFVVPRGEVGGPEIAAAEAAAQADPAAKKALIPLLHVSRLVGGGAGLEGAWWEGERACAARPTRWQASAGGLRRRLRYARAQITATTARPPPILSPPPPPPPPPRSKPWRG